MVAAVIGLGMTTPVGLSAAPTAAALRAGIARIREYAFDPLNEPAVPLAWVDDALLPRLEDAVGPVDEHWGRLVRLASHAISEAFVGISQPTALFIALPGERDCDDTRRDQRALADLQRQTGAAIDPRNSRVFRHGRAGGLLALQEALAFLGRGRVDQVCVGGVDSHFDSEILTRLAAAGRLHGEDSRDGFVPGEAAGFVMLGRARGRGVHVAGASHAQATSLREGTALALQALLGETVTPPIEHIYSGATGESVWPREWAIARLRCAEHLKPDARLDHPAEFIGDVGAAVGPLLLGLATIALTRGHRRSPCLVCCGSDRGERAAALVTLPEGRV